jgi:excisionase family DNA binding protein
MHESRPPIQQQPQQLLTPEEVATLLGVSRLFVIRQSRSGSIPAIKIGKCYRYRASTIDSWLREQEQSRGTRAPDGPTVTSADWNRHL